MLTVGAYMGVRAGGVIDTRRVAYRAKTGFAVRAASGDTIWSKDTMITRPAARSIYICVIPLYSDEDRAVTSAACISYIRAAPVISTAVAWSRAVVVGLSLVQLGVDEVTKYWSILSSFRIKLDGGEERTER